MRGWAFALAAIIASGTLFGIGLGAAAGPTEAPRALASHPAIRIEADSAFTSGHGVVGGTGGSADPYVIAGWEINASAADGIFISNTTAFVLIRDVYIHSGWNHTYSGNRSVDLNGIYLWNAQNVRIENATLYDNGNGMFLRDPMHVSVVRSEMAFNKAYGIGGFASNITILRNTFHDQGLGFRGGGSDGVIEANNFYANLPGGILFDTGTRWTIRDNNFADSQYYGISLGNVINAVVYHNNVLDDYYFSTSVTSGSVSWSAGYPLGGNYWSRYRGQDKCSGPAQDVCPDPDGIGDTPLDNNGPKLDPYPLMHPYGLLEDPPSATFDVVPSVAQVGSLIAVNASSSNDPDGPKAGVHHQWDWESDGIWDTGWLFSGSSEHAYRTPGTYVITLETRDVTGRTNLTTQTVTVVPIPTPTDYSPFVLAAIGGLIAVGYLFRRRKTRRGRTERPEPPRHRG